MDIFENRLSEVSQHYQNGDVSLGFRRMIDSALDTGKTSILKDMIEFTEWKYKAQPDTAAENQKAQGLILKIRNAGTPAKDLSAQPLILAKGISKSYSKGGFKLGPLDVSVQKSEIVGLVGENGNGKTTLLRALGGELQPDSGKIDYHFSTPYKNSYDLQTRLVYIPQRIEVLRGGLMDNLQFTLTTHGITGEDNFYLAQTMLARMGLWPYKDLNWNRLSSGYKMRFELARTLLRKPEVLLLDEPLANLDILAQQIILEDLRYLSSSLLHPFGVVLSSQQLYEVEKVSDKIIFLDKGKLVNDSSIQPEIENEKYLILEVDSSAEREKLQLQLQSAGLVKVHFNGGNYVLYFAEDKSIQDVMAVMSSEKIPVTYIRDISNSSRRFFIN
ncbi:ABC transporter ATP-binding protein [Moheibacter sediminis]|uniref:ABC-2 type transport system ATP-binding protein n=1 Tax=Moheibacter sediminis TaxID=1434700 RepID=A0A1W1Y7Z1_9FLAO|nr:ABC transporter ATP-binding protein [Moheibacter sediminis]SMC32273.1 ABC-2 type transport system ATP-binding protein [Moheibacter sediminis]